MTIAIDPHTAILVAVAVYFGIGGLFAAALAALSYGFAGRGDPMIVAVFFGWPFILLARIPGMAFILLALASATVMVLLAALILRAFQ
jgi:hypothetical protein